MDQSSQSRKVGNGYKFTQYLTVNHLIKTICTQLNAYKWNKEID